MPSPKHHADATVRAVRRARRARWSAAVAALVGAVLVGTGSGSASAVAPAPDPERSSAGGTGWYWLLNRSEAQLNDFGKRNGARIASIEVDGTNPYRFSAVLVANSGAYARPWSWWFDRDEAGVNQKVNELKGRLIDVEPYTVGRTRKFAFVMVANSGPAAKTWWWNYDLTAAQVTTDIDKYTLRLIDLDTYLVDGQRRYSYVGIANTGVDGTAWWWYSDATPAFIGAKARELGARVLDLEPTSAGRFAAVLVKNAGTYWSWHLGVTASRAEELIATHGVRITDVERYSAGGSSVYAFASVDNTEGESTRLRNLLDRTYDNASAFGPDVIRGVYVKQVGGPVIADVAARLRFQPLSTLKLLPYAYAWEQIDQGKATLDSTVSWIEATKDDSATSMDERRYASCLTSGTTTKSSSAKWRDALPTMMWESHNRTLDAFLDRFKPQTLTARAQSGAWGLTDTEMHFGCPQGSTRAPWAANRSTLVDLGKLFEGFAGLRIVSKPSSRDGFFANMINLTSAGASYASPITGATTGRFDVSFLRARVAREARAAKKRGVVDDFMKEIVIRGKGGSGGPSSNEVGFSDFLYVTLPFKQGSTIVPKSFVLGWFVYKLKEPSGCPDSSPSASCRALWAPEQNDLDTLKREMFNVPIRLALATW